MEPIVPKNGMLELPFNKKNTTDWEFVSNAIMWAEQTCDALELFLPSHEAEMNAFHRQKYGLEDRRVVDLPATYASFRLFFMVTNQHTVADDLRRFYSLNAHLVQTVVNDPVYTPLTNTQRVSALMAAGLDLHYGFVWRKP